MVTLLDTISNHVVSRILLVTRTEIPTQKSLRNSGGGKYFSIFNNETVRFVELMEVEYVNIA